MEKTFAYGERESVLGMKRRWSTSLGWPGNGKLELKRTLGEGWWRTQFRPGHVDDAELGGPQDLMERVGEDLVEAMRAKAAIRKVVTKMRRVLHD